MRFELYCHRDGVVQIVAYDVLDPVLFVRDLIVLAREEFDLTDEDYITMHDVPSEIQLPLTQNVVDGGRYRAKWRRATDLDRRARSWVDFKTENPARFRRQDRTPAYDRVFKAKEVASRGNLAVEKENHEDEWEDIDPNLGLGVVSGTSKQSISDVNSQEALLKLGMEPIPGVSRITFVKNNDTLFVILKPEVLKTPTSNAYVIFGEAKIEDQMSQLQNQAVEQFKAPNLSKMASKTEQADMAQDDGDIDLTIVNSKDIQAGAADGGETDDSKDQDEDDKYEYVSEGAADGGEKDASKDHDEDDKDEDDGEGLGDGTARSKQSISEENSQKTMLKLGMEPISGVSRIIVENTNAILFVILKPDVFKSPASDKYVIFDDAKIEDQTSQLQNQAIEQFKAPNLSKVVSETEQAAMAQDVEDVETAVEPKDIEASTVSRSDVT